MKFTKMVHDLLIDQVKPGDVTIDATTGNGHDTLHLAQLVGSYGQVYSFDIQKEALQTTRDKLSQAEHHEVQLVQDCHSRMNAHIPGTCLGKISAVVFNLGYLPGGDHQLVTRPYTSRQALNLALEFIAEHGMITVIAYSGHTGGPSEVKMIDEWIRDHQSIITCQKHSHQTTKKKNPSPVLYVIKRLQAKTCI